MKITKYIIVAFLPLIVFVCNDFLEEPDDVGGNTLETIFSRLSSAERVLAGAYSLAPWGFPMNVGPWGYAIMNYYAPIAAIADEGDVMSKNVEFLHARYHLGQLTASEVYAYREDKWDFDWQAIRSAWLFYDHADMIQESSRDVIEQRKAEALGMVATKYYELFKRYGGLPWIGQYYEAGTEVGMSRMSVTATADSIVKLCDRAIAVQSLPARETSSEFGRINKVAMMMLKARTLLVSASPLFNPQDNISYYPSFLYQDLIKHESYDRERWKLAADAAREAIDYAHANGYALNTNTGDPYTDYKAAITEFPEIISSTTGNVATNNPEIIWGTRLFRNMEAGSAGYMTRIYSTSNYTSGGGYCIPLQNIVDCYELKDGSPQTDDHYNQTDPYTKLDERFHTTILYHNRPFGNYTMDMSPEGDNNARVGSGFNFFGYYLTKFFEEMWQSSNQYQCGECYWPYMRLAELYLIYTEALCEYDYAANRQTILDYINPIRQRAGQPQLEDTPHFVDTQEHMRERIRNERAVELAFEEQRYFDLKRWKEGDKLGGNMYGMEVLGTAEEPQFNRFLFEERIFTDKWYLYPIKEEDVMRSQGQVIQNPGW